MLVPHVSILLHLDYAVEELLTREARPPIRVWLTSRMYTKPFINFVPSNVLESL